MIVLLLCLPLLVFSIPTAFNIVDYGAIGDGRTLNTKAFRLAFLAAEQTIARNPGLRPCRVIVPSGRFLTGAFNLSSGVYLELKYNDSIVLASDDPNDYVCLPSYTFDTGKCDFPFIAAVNISDTGIIGFGAVNGGANDPPGHLVDHYDPVTNMLIPKLWKLNGCEGYSCRPKLVVFKDSRSLKLTGVSILNSPLWTVTIVQCINVLVDSVRVIGDRRWPNNDGIDPINSINVSIINSYISAGDDAICLSSHTPFDMSHVTVRNCTLLSTSAALKITTYDPNASGSISYVFFDNLTVLDSNRGISIMPRIGSGDIHDISFTNIVMETHYFSEAWWGSAEPIYVTNVDQSPGQQYTGRIHNIRFQNIRSKSEAGVVLYSENTPLDYILLKTVVIDIAKFSNVSRPCLDLRPCYCGNNSYNCLPYADTDAVLALNIASLTLYRVYFTFQAPSQPYYGICYNATNVTTKLSNDLHCKFR